jgi:NAD(P)-dependent dehydrogenase (short-subunit alcohol dehydrogenase family)
MKIIIVGNGLIGRAVAESLRGEHEVITASRSDRTHPVDLASEESVNRFLSRVGEFDALACAAGEAWIGPFAELDRAKLEVGFRSKLGGQLQLVLKGREYVRPKGSFTLISGFLSTQPVAGTATLTAVNGAINAFVHAAAAEMRPLRINAVSPGLIHETAEQMGASSPPGVKPVPLSDVVWAYRLSILGIDSGRVFTAHGC